MTDAEKNPCRYVLLEKMRLVDKGGRKERKEDKSGVEGDFLRDGKAISDFRFLYFRIIELFTYLF